MTTKELTIKCDYPGCENQIREEDKLLKPETAKLCEMHNEEICRYIDSGDTKKLLGFMVKCSFK